MAIPEQRFEEIIDAALLEAARLDATPHQYRMGLHEWVARIEESIEASRESSIKRGEK